MIHLRLRQTKWRFIISLRGSQTLPGALWLQCRGLSSAEVTTALRPFYFLVHPDLFGQHPRAQHINDASLKLLNNHLDLLINDQRPGPVHLQFYVRNKNTEGSLNTVELRLNKPSLRETVHGILSVFHLPTKYLDSLPHHSHKPDRKIKWSRSFYDATHIFNLDEELSTARKREDL